MYPVSDEIIDALFAEKGLSSIAEATIRQIVSIASRLEEKSGEEVIHLEIGNPGIPASEIGIMAECEALKAGIANKYPDIAGIPAIKKAGARFVKAFLDVDTEPRCIVPTVGSMQGTFTVMLLMSHLQAGRDTMLFIDPGFPPNHAQAHLLGMKQESFDLYEYRGAKLRAKLDEVLGTGRVAAMLYSNPNNPAWTNLTQEELRIIGEAATKYDVVVMEDLAYMGMDFRSYFGEPFKAPFIPSVAKYTDNYIQFLSGSKIFSYAGQRISIVNFSPSVADRHTEEIHRFFNKPTVLDAYVFSVIYAVSSGTAHSAQIAMAEMLNAACDGKLDFVGKCEEYKRRCARTKKLFLDNGFHVVYDKDGDQPVSDGFFFTAGYDGLDSDELQKELLRYGVASISLPSTGSHQKGLRICPSMLQGEDKYRMLEERLRKFNQDHLNL